MRVAVGIPSYQEADSIAHVVMQVDRGLARRFDPARSTIVNVDGDSPDGTAGVFLGVRGSHLPQHEQQRETCET